MKNKLISTALLTLLRVRVNGTERLQRLHEGPHIIACNHVSFLDGLLIALISPVPLAFAVDTYYSRRACSAKLGMDLLSRLGYGRIIPVDSGSPYGLRELLRALKNGESVAIFPEGAISYDGKPLVDKPGLKWLMKKSGVPVIRMTIYGAEKSRFFAKSGQEFWPEIHVIVGS